MTMMFVIARRELQSLFFSPLAWTVLAVVQFLLAWMFLLQVDQFLLVQSRLAGMEGAPGVTDLIVVPLLSSASVVLLLVVPLLSMRLIAEEKRSGTITLLRAAPVSTVEIVLGKFFGIMGFFAILLGLVTLMILSLLLGTDLDLGKTFAGLLGLLLMLGAFASAGLFMSTLTRQPVVAAMSAFGLLLLLWLIDAAGKGTDGVTGWLSLLNHYQQLLRGVFASGDVIYYIVFMTAFLVFSIRKLDAERLQR